jgi:hypothetical protein
MTITDPHTEERLRQGFKHFNRFMMLMWRLGLGPWVNAWPEVGGRIMVITHTGRKTGIRRRTPVNYTIADGEVYCTSGFGASRIGIATSWRFLRLRCGCRTVGGLA